MNSWNPQVAQQIPLPIENPAQLNRANFIVGDGNRDAFAFLESWPSWSVAAAALYGPASSGKTHLVRIWMARSGAQTVVAAALSGSAFVLLDRTYPIVIEDIDSSLPNPARDAAIFDLLGAATCEAPVLLTGRSEPSSWPAILPDLSSRFGALVSFSLWTPDEALLKKLTHKLFEDRQLTLPDSTVEQILRLVERSPAAVREFIAHADARALSEGRPFTPALVRELLNGRRP